MRIKAGYRITYDCPSPTPMLLMLQVRPERQGDLETPDFIGTDPMIPVRLYIDVYGNTCGRILAPAGRTTLSSEFVIRDRGLPDVAPTDTRQAPVEDLPDEALQFLLGSRYCDTQALDDLAWKLFSGTTPGWERALAVVDYVHNRIKFGYEHARSTKTALEAHEEQQGVCRDYAHLAVTLCRCLNIPARYCTGYLGDIGIAPSNSPMDFSAWFEVYIGGAWHTLDARHKHPRVGRILMARGRDAADVAITTTFGAANLTGFEVITEQLD